MIQAWHPQRWLRFIFVGSIGFFIDGGVLVLLVHQLSFDPVFSRVVSFSIAVLVTWKLNREFTFQNDFSGNLSGNLQRYLSISVIGFLLNFGIYLWLLTNIATVTTYPLLGVIPSSGIAMVVTYWGNSRFVFN